MWQRLAQCIALLAVGLLPVQPAWSDAPAGPVLMRLESRGEVDRVWLAWRRIADYRVERRGDAVTIVLPQTSGIEGAAAIARASALIRAVSRRTDATDATITLILVPEARIRYFRRGTDIVVDVLPPLTPPAKPAGDTLAAATLR